MSFIIEELWAAYDWAVREVLPDCADLAGDSELAAVARSLPPITPDTYLTELVRDRVFRPAQYSALQRLLVHLAMVEEPLVDPLSGLPRHLDDAGVSSAAGHVEDELRGLVAFVEPFFGYRDQVVTDVLQAGMTPVVAVNYRRLLGLPTASGPDR